MSLNSDRFRPDLAWPHGAAEAWGFLPPGDTSFGSGSRSGCPGCSCSFSCSSSFPGPFHVGLPLSSAPGRLLCQLCSLSLDCLRRSQEARLISVSVSSFCATSTAVSGLQTDMHKGLLETVTQLSHRRLTLISSEGSTLSKTSSLPVASILESRIALSNPERHRHCLNLKETWACLSLHGSSTLSSTSQHHSMSLPMARATIVSLKEDLPIPLLLSLPFLKPIFYTEGSDHSDLFKIQVSLAPCYVNPAGPPTALSCVPGLLPLLQCLRLISPTPPSARYALSLLHKEATLTKCSVLWVCLEHGQLSWP